MKKYRITADITVEEIDNSPAVVVLPSAPEWSFNAVDHVNGARLLGVDGIFDTSGEIVNTPIFKGIKHTQQKGSDCAQSYGFGKNLSDRLVKGDEFWAKGRFLYPANWDFSNAHNRNLGGTATRCKMFRLQTFTDKVEHRGYNDVYLCQSSDKIRWQFIYEGKDEWAFSGLDGWVPTRPLAPATKIVPGNPVDIEYYVKLDDKAGTVRLWEDGKLSFEITDLATLVAPTDYASLFRFCTYVNGGAPADQSIYTDNWVMCTSHNKPTNKDAAGNLFIG